MSTRFYPHNRFVPGDSKHECDICGFDYLRSQLKRIPGSQLLACPEDYDPKYAGSRSAAAMILARHLGVSGLGSGVTFGTTDVHLGGVLKTLYPSSIASGLAFGAPVITRLLDILSPDGIASGLAFGTGVVSPGLVTLSPSAIASTLGFGSPEVKFVTSITATGIASTLAYGSPTLTTGSVTISPTGLASGLAFGTTVVSQPVSYVVQDTFTDTSATVLSSHTGETGATWTKHASFAGSAAISSANRARNNSANPTLYYASGTPATAEYNVECNFHVFTTAYFAGLVGRVATGAITFYEVYHTAGTWYLRKRIAGAITQLQTYVQALNNGQTYTLRLEIKDATKKVFIDGIERMSDTDNSITAAGKAGVWYAGGWSDSAGFHIDDFTVSNI